MFNFLRKKTPLVEKLNTTIINYKGVSDKNGSDSKIWRDNIRPHMPKLIINNQSNFTDASHREAQIRQNPDLYKLTYKHINKLFSKEPYPFSRVKPYKRQSNGQNEESDTESTSKRTNSELKVKSNGIASKDSNFMLPTTPGGGGGLFDNPIESGQQDTKYEIREDLDYLYTEWDKTKFWSIIKEAAALAYGVNCCAIVETEVGDIKTYWVFTRSNIVTGYTYERLLYKITIKWSAISGAIQEDSSDVSKKLGQSNITYTINGMKNYKPNSSSNDEVIDKCVFFAPWTTPDQYFGHPRITPSWDSAIYNLNSDFYRNVLIHNGGIVERFNRYPNNMDTSISDIENNQKAGICGGIVSIEYPPGANPEHIDKFFQHETQIAENIDFTENHDLNSQNFPITKSFMDESSQNDGGLGGSFAAKQDKENTNEDIFVEWKVLEPLIKLCDKIFFGVDDDDYMVVPWIDDKGPISEEKEGLKNEVEKTGLQHTIEENKLPVEKPKDDKPKEKKNSLMVKFNSLTEDGLYLYQGDILSVGPLPQIDNLPADDPNQEYQFIDEEAIRKFAEDPKSVKEYYHTSGKHLTEIKKEDATAKVQIIGVNPETKGLLANIYYYKDPQKEELDMSPRYFCREEVRPDGKTYQVDLDIRNNIDTLSPRAKGRTKVKRL